MRYTHIPMLVCAIAVAMDAASVSGQLSGGYANAHRAAPTAAQSDSVLAVITAPKSGTELVLTDRQIIFRYTEHLIRGLKSQGNRDTVSYASGAIHDIWNGIGEDFRRNSKAFSLHDIQQIQYNDGALTIQLTERAVASGVNRGQKSFRYSGVGPKEARTFIERFEQLAGAG